MRTFRLFYLGNAFPPGVSAVFPELQPAGHLIETSLIHSLSDYCAVRSVGISRIDVAGLTLRAASPGLPNTLNLLERPPEIWHRWRALRLLRRHYQKWQTEGWQPDLIMVCNFSPVYNAFIRQIARQAKRPNLVLYMADSTILDAPLSPTRRLRYRLKPFKWLDNEMAELYDACVAVSAETEARFKERNVPWLWLPNGIDPARARRNGSATATGPITFGYFGHAGDHSGISHLLEVFTAASRPAQLKVSCFGKARAQLMERFGQARNVSFHGPFDPEGCVDFGASCDVLVNPRPRMPGNRNNFPSKVFEYALTGRAVLANQLSGCDRILGPHAYYFDGDNYRPSLARMLDSLAATPRPELRERGAALQRHMLTEYCWQKQGQRLAAFLADCLGSPRARTSLHDAPREPVAASKAALSFASSSSSYNLRDLR
ncbi:MAG TPA: glycosyltransferase [Verrucomicrobiae bacterium]|nr:glycosyltransferase [Verrucomicrobiae bacterium]